MHTARRFHAMQRMSFLDPQMHATWQHARRGLEWLARHSGDFALDLTDALPSPQRLTELLAWVSARQTAASTSLAKAHHRHTQQTRRGPGKYRFVCKQYLPPNPFVADTCDRTEIDAHVRGYWRSIWQDSPPPTPAQRTLLDRLPLPHAAARLQPLTPETLQSYLRSHSGVAGPCGWRVQELRRLPSPFLAQLCEVFSLMEHCGVAMSIACEGDVSMIPKREHSAAVEDPRPITVLLVPHRLWSGTRLRCGLLEWQESIIGTYNMRACKPRNSCFDPTLPAALFTERARLRNMPLVAVCYDLAKAFDTLPFGRDGIGWALLVRMGFPAPLLAVLQDMYSRLRRRFKVAGTLGRTVDPAGLRGVVQGCAISMLLCHP